MSILHTSLISFSKEYVQTSKQRTQFLENELPAARRRARGISAAQYSHLEIIVFEKFLPLPSPRYCKMTFNLKELTAGVFQCFSLQYLFPDLLYSPENASILMHEICTFMASRNIDQRQRCRSRKEKLINRGKTRIEEFLDIVQQRRKMFYYEQFVKGIFRH